jgi:hypothetical protein
LRFRLTGEIRAVAVTEGGSGGRRKLGIAPAVLWGLGTFFIGVIVMGFYIAGRPLKANEVREGGYAWNVVKGFAVTWSIFIVAIGISAVSAASQTSADTAANVGLGAVLILPVVWFFVMVMALVLGYFLRNPAIVERGPTGPLAQESRVV